MKLTTKVLKQIIREQLEEVGSSGTGGQDLAQRIKDFFESIRDEAVSLGTDISLEDVQAMSGAAQDFLNTVATARRKARAAQRDPEAKRLAAQKGLATRAKNKQEDELASKRRRAEDEKEEKRIAAGGMPKTMSDYSGTPDPQYYEFDYADPRSGINMYRLKGEKDYYAPAEKPIIRMK